MKVNKQISNIKGSIAVIKNPIAQMIEDKKKMIDAAKNGKSISSVKGIKIVSPL